MAVGRIQKRNAALALLFVLLGVAFAMTYSFVIHAPSKELEQTKQQLEQEKQLLAAVDERLVKQQGELQSTLNLQRKLPVEPLIDQYLLDLEKVELLSGSQLQNIGISEGDAAALFANPNAAAAANVQTDTGGNQEAQGTTQEAQPQAEQTPDASAVKRLTFSLSVNTPDYSHMLKFVKKLEELQRVSKIDSFSFTGGQESAGAVPGGSGMKFTVTVSTFYVSQMDELKNGLPWVEYPKPANKSNPLLPSSAS
ncbi:hypothetical protein [Paenibacillus montanisoli]|uniref:Pilus assembly protein PilO n=1 Tax=Paenibacillus montanisoli TaxID=2081970 RepID=A0A328TZ04_9BACL|nr:hypothetical protein [Paenibacillus montanisoli]RAP74743.1 hypothetical protein DL346_22145 [Paenibacillus montanisoli]